MENSESHRRTRSRIGLTDTRVKNLNATGKLSRVWDSHVPGFHVQITPQGAKSFRVCFQRPNGQKASVTIGTFGAWTVDTAREKARELRKIHESGRDVKATLKAERSAVNMVSLAKAWREDYAPRLKPSTRKSYESLLNSAILPAIGTRLVKDLTYEDVKVLYRKVQRKTPIHANRMAAVLSKLFNIAEREGWRPDGSNPCRKLEKGREKPRNLVYNAGHLKALEAGLKCLVSKGELDGAIADLIRFIALSGLRRGEAVGLTWKDVDLDAGVMSFTEHKTDQDGTKHLPLNTHLREIIRRRSEDRICKFVFPGRLMDRPFNGFGKIWERIREVSGLQGFNPHDLRHTFLTTCVELGNAVAIGDTLLGHSLGRIRDTYLTLRPDGVMAQASQQTADWIAAAMSGANPKLGEKISLPSQNQAIDTTISIPTVAVLDLSGSWAI
jgi:integrase